MKKWENIKKACAEKAYNEVYRAQIGEIGALITAVSMRVTLVQGYRESRQHDKIRQELANQVYDTIMNWDVRSFKSLQQLYPEQFPKGELRAYTLDDENMTWVIDKTEVYT